MKEVTRKCVHECGGCFNEFGHDSRWSQALSNPRIDHESVLSFILPHVVQFKSIYFFINIYIFLVPMHISFCF
jgi:hypothetical protein